MANIKHLQNRAAESSDNLYLKDHLPLLCGREVACRRALPIQMDFIQ